MRASAEPCATISAACCATRLELSDSSRGKSIKPMLLQRTCRSTAALRSRHQQFVTKPRLTSTMAASTAAPTSKMYEELADKLKDISALSGISGLLGWDEMVMMPEGASGSRGAQKAALAGVLYDKRTDKQLGSLLEELRAAPKGELDAVQAAVVRDSYKAFVRETAIPKALAQRIAKLESDAYMAWADARKTADFSKFAPFLQQWVDVSKEKAAAIDPNADIYDVLLDDFEKGLTSKRIDEIFAQVREGLIPFIAELRRSTDPPQDDWLKGDYDVERQAALCKQIALDLGFDITRGRLDVSLHPFTGGAHPTDVRMTTRFKAHDLTEGLTGAIHETGHALYEQGRNAEWDGLPVSNAMSMGIHESQSLLWERMVALGRPFQSYLLPKITEAFSSFPQNRTADDLYAAQNCLKERSLIRVEADEVTYPLHVILRYEIERGLLDGSIAVKDVPVEWNSRMQKYLGVTPKDDAEGCLQDMHWCAGVFGYFPTYTLGAMYACQIYRHASTQMPDLEQQIAAGNFAPLKSWLNEHIHKLGSLHANGDELMEAVTGSPLDPSIFLGYLRDKYSKLYKLQ